MKYFPLILAFAFSGAAFAGGDGEDHIAKYDNDNDGQLSRMEAESDPALSARFDEVDADGDGQLNGEEVAAVEFEETSQDEPLFSDPDPATEDESYEDAASDEYESDAAQADGLEEVNTEADEGEELEEAEATDEDWNS